VSPERLEIFANRWFQAPIELAFRAFVEPSLLEQWFCPSPEVALRVEHCDVRAGGRYRFVFYFPPGRAVPVVGEYRIVEPPDRLVFTWTWEEPDPWASVETIVSVQFVARDGGTEVRVNHTQLSTREIKETHESGWQATLEHLDAVLAQQSGDRSKRPEGVEE
jgi:uncharacterized protein YndB with AHSA1/START domain